MRFLSLRERVSAIETKTYETWRHGPPKRRRELNPEIFQKY